MDIVNILNEKEAGGSNNNQGSKSSTVQPVWPKAERNSPEQYERKEPVRLPSLITPSSFSTYPHAPFAPKYSFEVQPAPSPRTYSTSTSTTNPEISQPSPTEDPSKPYHCKTCQKGFARRSDLSRHERIHSGVRPHICDFEGCGKQFIQRSALTVHSRVHTGEKPHMCEACGKPFSDSSSLARHRRIHSGKRPYKCPYADCQKTFTRRTTLTRHQNHHTGTISEAAAATAAALAGRRSSSKSSIQLTNEENMESVSQSYTGSNSSLRISEEQAMTADHDKAAILGWRDGQSYRPATPLSSVSAPTIPATLVAGTAALHISNARSNLRGLSTPGLSTQSQPRSMSPSTSRSLVSPLASGGHQQWQSPGALFSMHTPVSLSPHPGLR